MIEDARVLRTGFVPSEVEHRDAEVNHLSSILEGVAHGDATESVLLTGPSGAGKTCIAQFTVDRLRQEHLDVEYQYVNCWQNHSSFRTLHRILEGIGRATDVHRQSTPHDELVERLREYDGHPYVVVLDEVDQLEDKSILYDLHSYPRFSTVLIANSEEELFATADERLTSRLTGSERIRFDRYGVDELVSILEARVRWGLSEGVIATDQLATIADEAAGDARVAISILRNAARRAQRNQLGEITDAVIETAVPKGRQEIHQRDLSSLTADQRTIYEIIDERGEIQPSELYETYRERVDDPKTDRTVRNYLEKMLRYNLVVAEGSSRDRRYRLPEQLQ